MTSREELVNVFYEQYLKSLEFSYPITATSQAINAGFNDSENHPEAFKYFDGLTDIEEVEVLQEVLMKVKEHLESKS